MISSYIFSFIFKIVISNFLRFLPNSGMPLQVNMCYIAQAKAKQSSTSIVPSHNIFPRVLDGT
uniref:Uncharacterized protein n=1 Tax=Daphnia magna TaxID=35525 RepID=A0A0P6BLA3_9CRUS